MPKRCRVEKKTLMEIFARHRDNLVIPKRIRIAPKSHPIWLTISADLKYAVTPANAYAIACKMNFQKLAESARPPELSSDRRAKYHCAWDHLYRAMIRRRKAVLVIKPATVVPIKNPVWTSIANELENAYAATYLRSMATTDPAFRNLLLSDAPAADSSVVKPEKDHGQANDDLTPHNAVLKLLETTNSLAADVTFLKRTEKYCRKILGEIRTLRCDLSKKNF